MPGFTWVFVDEFETWREASRAATEPLREGYSTKVTRSMIGDRERFTVYRSEERSPRWES